jgi:site-specific recombinase XerC
MNYLLREKLDKIQPCYWHKTPKAPKRLPDVLDVDQVNQLLKLKQPIQLVLRDKAILNCCILQD